VVALDRFRETIERTPGLVERIFTPGASTQEIVAWLTERLSETPPEA